MGGGLSVSIVAGRMRGWLSERESGWSDERLVECKYSSWSDGMLVECT